MEETHECSTIIGAGDFNLTFSSHEMKNRLYPAQYKRVVAVVKEMIDNSGLKDVWSNYGRF